MFYIFQAKNKTHTKNAFSGGWQWNFRKTSNTWTTFGGQLKPSIRVVCEQFVQRGLSNIFPVSTNTHDLGLLNSIPVNQFIPKPVDVANFHKFSAFFAYQLTKFFVNLNSSSKRCKRSNNELMPTPLSNCIPIKTTSFPLQLYQFWVKPHVKTTFLGRQLTPRL